MKKPKTVVWDMVLEWDEGCHHDNCRQQKLSFDFRDSFLAASRKANELRLMLARGCGVQPHQCQLVYFGKKHALEQYLAVRSTHIAKLEKEREEVAAKMAKPNGKSKVKTRKVQSTPSDTKAFRVREH